MGGVKNMEKIVIVSAIATAAVLAPHSITCL